MTVSDSTPTQGQTITASGSGFRANTEITVTIQSVLAQLATPRSDASGAFSAQITIPSTTTLGAHTLSASGLATGGTRVLTAAITVVASSSGGNALPKSGSALPIASGAMGSALLAVGSALHGWSRRRRSDLDVGPLPVQKLAQEPQLLGTNWGRAGHDELGLSTSTIWAGGSIRVTGAGFSADTDITIFLAAPDRLPRVIEYARTFPTGTFVVDAHISHLAHPGPRTITAIGSAPDGSSRELSSTLTIAEIAD